MPINLGMIGIDKHHIADELGAAQIARDHRADRAGARAGADQCNGFRVEQLVEITNRHWRSSTAQARIPNVVCSLIGREGDRSDGAFTMSATRRYFTWVTLKSLK